MQTSSAVHAASAQLSLTRNSPLRNPASAQTPTSSSVSSTKASPSPSAVTEFSLGSRGRAKNNAVSAASSRPRNEKRAAGEGLVERSAFFLRRFIYARRFRRPVVSSTPINVNTQPVNSKMIQAPDSSTWCSSRAPKPQVAVVR